MTDFGRDTSCTAAKGLRSGRLSNGARLVAEALERRLSTTRGTLRGGEQEANYGINLAEEIGATTSPEALSAKIKAEAAKDERIERTDVVVVKTTDGPAISYAVTVTGYTAAGPFTLRLAVSEVKVELLGIEA